MNWKQYCKLLYPYSEQRLSTGDMIAGDDDFGKGFFTDL